MAGLYYNGCVTCLKTTLKFITAVKIYECICKSFIPLNIILKHLFGNFLLSSEKTHKLFHSAYPQFHTKPHTKPS